MDYFRYKSAVETVNWWGVQDLLFVVASLALPTENWLDAGVQKNVNIMIAKVTGYFRGHGN